jgi:hypothetical protein
LWLKHPAFDFIKETNPYVAVKLSRAFVLMNKAGTLLFERSAMLMPLIRVDYQNRELKIRLFKKGAWFDNLEKLLNVVMGVYDELAGRDEPRFLI